ncbi:TIGR02147 family protein [Bdellovibrionota bacterium FG-1]
MKEQFEFQKLLVEKITEIRLRNPSYSVRAFACKAGISSSALSEILNGKRHVSKALARKITQKLCVDPDRAANILSGFPEKSRRKRAQTVQAVQYSQLNMDHFRVISDWYHFAIQSLSETENYRHDSEWISKRLNIKSKDAACALDRLERLGMLELDDTGRPVRGAPAYVTTDDIADLSLRKVHAQNLELAKDSLENDSVSERDFTAMTMAIDPDQLPAAKKMIREFQDRLCAFLESGRKKEVHKLCIQLIPLTKPETIKEDIK